MAIQTQFIWAGSSAFDGNKLTFMSMAARATMSSRRTNSKDGGDLSFYNFNATVVGGTGNDTLTLLLQREQQLTGILRSRNTGLIDGPSDFLYDATMENVSLTASPATTPFRSILSSPTLCSPSTDKRETKRSPSAAAISTATDSA